MNTHDETVRRQFDPRASAYLTSAVHAAGPDLAHASALIAALAPASRGIDIGTGAGHLAFAMAGRLAQVVASDPSPAMLATVAAAARERGLRNVETCEAGAASLPFAPGTFDLVGTRYSAHHWLDLDGSLSEMRRVARPGGTLLVIDVVGDADPLVDTHLQAMELLRDPGHVRNRDAGQWRAAIVRAGFRLQQEATFPVRLDFAAWIERMRTPPETAAAIRRLQDGAPRQVVDALGIGEDGSFMVTTGLFAALAR